MERKTITTVRTRTKKKSPSIMRRKKKKKLKRDPDMVMKLDLDILLEIFSQIPFKKVVQCRYVCKSWRTLLDDNFLINIHAKSLLKLHGYNHHLAQNSSSSSSIVSFISFSQRIKTSLFGFYDDNLCSYKESSFNDSSSNLNDATIVNSCNGLICLKTDAYKTIAIYNPVTTEFLRLPPCGDGYKRTYGGFGYHPSTKEYKILGTICRYEAWSSIPYNCPQIYTLGTGRWKDIEGPSCRSFNYDVPGVHVNGALYWIKEENYLHWINKENWKNNKKREMIMSFDLANEEFRILTTLPPLLYNMNPKPYYKLVESQGCLFLFVDQYSSHDDPHIELWVMEKEKEKENGNDHDNGYRYYWSNLMEISTVGHQIGDSEFLALTQSGKVLFRHNGVLTCFDPKTKRFTSIRDVSASLGRYRYLPTIVPHTNSLVSLMALGSIPKNK